MRKHLFVALAATAALAFSAFGPGLAGAATVPTGVTDTISIQEVKGALKFVAPGALPGGVQASLRAGLHWQKAAIWLLLDLEI